MRSVGLSDLDMAARAVLVLPAEDQARGAEGLIWAAHQADLVRKRSGRSAPCGGTGSLYAQAALGEVSPIRDATPAYCTAMAHVLCALEGWRQR